MNYTIYLRTNKINGKQYVGQSGDFETREKQFKRINQRYANKRLSEDRRKYGLDNFDLKILAEVKTQEEAWELERKYIKDLNTKYPNGYNMSDGGKTNANFLVSDDTRKKMSEAAKKWWDGINDEEKENFSNKMSEIMRSQERKKIQSTKMLEFYEKHPEAIEKMREIGKTLVGEKNPFFGHHHTDAYKKQKSENSKGKHYSRETEFPSKVVYKYDLNYNLLETYPSASECARQNGVTQSAIVYAVLYSKKHICKGHIYSYEPMQPLN